MKHIKNNLTAVIILVAIISVLAGCDKNFRFDDDFQNGSNEENLSLKDFSEEWDRIINLNGKWKFNIGDENEFSSLNFDHSKWDNVWVPSPWENEGFPGYDGFGWYRKTFYVPKTLMNESVYLKLGYVDDVDEVYINGKLIGSSGEFPPNYKTAYNAERIYFIPDGVLKYEDDNIIAVRVYDAELEGGINRGETGIYVQNIIMPSINLEGQWKFAVMNSNEDNFDEQIFNQYLNEESSYQYMFDTINVPGFCETQGYQDFEGFALYQKECIIPNNFKDKELVLLLGKIDDFDETYFNGVKIGSTGNMQNAGKDWVELGDAWLKYRVYNIPANQIKYNDTNVISVKIFDGYINGGIYSGPVGIIEKDRLASIKHKLKNY